MKNIALLLTLASTLSAQNIFISPTGNDKNPASLRAPLHSIKEAFSLAQPGDHLYLRAGQYPLGIYINASGTSKAPITLEPYQHEKVLFKGDKSHQNNDFRIRGNWIIINDIEIKHSYNGLLLEHDASHNIINHVHSHHNHFSGFVITRGAAYNTIVNCEANDNFDKGGSMGDGGNADGFGTGSRIGDTQYIGPGNRFINCKSWHNSDDGFDFWKSGNPILVINCQAYNNGFAKGDGNGFKLGPNNPIHSNDHHIVINSEAWDNIQNGFDFNENEDAMTLYNNTSYRNAVNYKFLGHGKHQFINNVSIKSHQPNKLSSHILDIDNQWNASGKFTPHTR